MRYPFLHDEEGGDVDLEITAQGLCFVNDAGRSATIDWPQIRQVRLYCDEVAASLFSRLSIPTFRYFCEITLRNKKRIVIVSGFLDEQRHWVGMGPSYRAFVEHLHDRLHAVRSRARFRRGLTWLGFLRFFGTTLLRSGWWPVEGWPIIGRHFPRCYRPKRMPQALLPPV
jgi:hypothetical protein